MQESKIVAENYRKLAEVCYEILYSEDFARVVSGERKSLQEAFFRNLFKVLQSSLDLTISRDKLEEFIDKNGKNPEKEALAEFLGKSLENIETYTLINYYFLQFIIVLSKYAAEDQKKKIEQLIAEKGLQEKDLTTIEDLYSNLVSLRAEPIAC